MGARRIDLRGSFARQRLGRLHQRPRRIDNVVHDQRTASANVADQVHHFADIHVHAALVHDGQRRI